MNYRGASESRRNPRLQYNYRDASRRKHVIRLLEKSDKVMEAGSGIVKLAVSSTRLRAPLPFCFR